MAELQIFKNDEFGEVRTTIIDNEPYFCGNDVAKALRYANPQKAVRDHCEIEGVNELFYPTEGGNQMMKFISLSNVIRLIVAASKQSKNGDMKEKAKKYERWIFEDIMPSIHKNGYYAMPGVQVPDFRDIPLEALASYQRIQRTVMKDLGKSPKEIATEFKKVSLQFGINLSDNFDQLAFEQESLF